LSSSGHRKKRESIAFEINKIFLCSNEFFSVLFAIDLIGVREIDLGRKQRVERAEKGEKIVSRLSLIRFESYEIECLLYVPYHWSTVRKNAQRPTLPVEAH
jgi:hypothetical protein